MTYEIAREYRNCREPFKISETFKRDVLPEPWEILLQVLKVKIEGQMMFVALL